jgi:hypothetical protein
VSGGGAFGDAVREALRAPGGRSLAAHFPAPLVTALVAGGPEREQGRLTQALATTLEALERAGVPRGRQFVLLARGAGREPHLEPARLRAALGVPVLVHDPDGPHFTAGRASDGGGFEVDDELREAEALLVLGPEVAPGNADGGLGLLCPGVVSSGTASAWAALRRRDGERAARAFVLELERALAVDLVLTWDARGEVTAGGGRERFEAMARAGAGA